VKDGKMAQVTVNGGKVAVERDNSKPSSTYKATISNNGGAEHLLRLDITPMELRHSEPRMENGLISYRLKITDLSDPKSAAPIFQRIEHKQEMSIEQELEEYLSREYKI
jgi:hypothetical protein